MQIRIKSGPLGSGSWLSDVVSIAVNVASSSWNMIVEGYINVAGVWQQFFGDSPPVNTVVPTITGTVEEAQLVGSTDGTWTGSPTITYTYQWKYQDSLTVWLSIAGATSSSYSIPVNWRATYGGYSYNLRLYVTGTNSFGNSTANSISHVVAAATATVPDAPTTPYVDLGNGTSKYISWVAPASDGGTAITAYQVNVDGTGWNNVTPTATNTYITLTLSAGAHTVQVRAVNAIGAGSALSMTAGSFVVPTINSGPTASSITSTSATISWTSSNQSSYSLSVPGAPGTPFTGAGGTSVNLTGLTPGAGYVPTLTITSSTADTHQVAGSFTASAVQPPTITSYSATSSTITLYFTLGTNATSTKAYVGVSFDGNTAGTSYTFLGLSPSTSYSLFLKGFDGTNISVTQSGGSYSTTAAATVPGAPTSLTKATGDGASKYMSWSAPASDGGSAITAYQANINNTGWVNVTPTATNTYITPTFAPGGNTFQVRAVNAVGAGASVTTGSFTVPIINSGPTASSITATTASISWTSSSQNSFSLSVPGASPSLYSSGGSPVSVTGMTTNTGYTPTLTITSITGDTHQVAGSFSTVSPPPTIAAGSWSGTFVVGNTVTYTRGAATNETSTTIYIYNGYGTLRASSSGTASLNYTLVAGDVGAGMQGYATATGTGGTATSSTSTSTTVANPPPPTIAAGSWSGTFVVGNTVTYTRGAATNETSTTIYIYNGYGTLRASSSGVNSLNYTLVSGDSGAGMVGYATATGAGGTATSSSSTSTTVTTPSPPSGGSVSLSPGGTQYDGTLLTASTSGWSGSPSSYSVRIYASTSNPPNTGSILKANSSGASSVSYTITALDAAVPSYYFKAFATATNGSGTSSEVGSGVTTSTPTPGSPPPVPTGVTNTYNGGTSYTFSWTASAGATSYTVNYGENSTAPSPNPPASVIGNITTGNVNAGGSVSYAYTSFSSTNYVGFRVQAVGPGGTSAFSGITLYK